MLERHFPDRYIGRYSLIVHHIVPYKFARQAGAIQSGLDVLCAGLGRAEDVDLKKAEESIVARLDLRRKRWLPI